jgi:hypothetical protein
VELINQDDLDGIQELARTGATMNDWKTYGVWFGASAFVGGVGYVVATADLAGTAEAAAEAAKAAEEAAREAVRVLLRRAIEAGVGVKTLEELIERYKLDPSKLAQELHKVYRIASETGVRAAEHAAKVAQRLKEIEEYIKNNLE